MFSHNLNVLINNNVNNKIYKLILNLSAVRGTHKVPGQPSPAGHHSHLAMAVCLYHTNYGNKKDVGVCISPRLSLSSGSRIAPT
jgi:hypothetical protein